MVSTAAIDGAADLHAVENAMTDPRVRSLQERMTVQLDPRLEAMTAERLPARVAIVYVDGAYVEAATECPIGDPDNPMPSTDVVEKFCRLATEVNSSVKAEELADVVMHMEHEHDGAFAHALELLRASSMIN